jgi:lysyl-tRNA synthetase class 1
LIYHQQLRAYPTQTTQKLNNPVFTSTIADVPVSTMVVPFAMLLNLASVYAGER